jgi:hypothetical protein
MKMDMLQINKKRKSIFWTLVPIMLLGLLFFLNRAATAGPDSPDGPVPWGDELFVSTNSPNGAFVPVIGRAPNGTLMIVYRHRTAGAINIPYYATSGDNGVTWGTPAPIRNSSIDIPQVTFAYDSNNVAHAVWRTNTDILHSSQSQWPGAGTPIVSTVQSVQDPDIAIAADDTLHVVWAQGTGLETLNIYHAYSQSGGAGWTVSPVLATDTRKSTGPAVAIDGSGNVHVVWEERTFNIDLGDFVTEIRYKKGTWTGGNLNWAANPTTISDPDTDGKQPEITAAGDQIHVSYMRQDEETEQYPMYTKYNGSVWTTPIDTSLGNPISVNQSDPFFLITTIATCNNIVYLYYHGALSDVGKEQILGAGDDDNWAYQNEVTEDITRSINPSLTCFGDNLYMAFERIEESGPNAGTNQIYFVGAVQGGKAHLPAIFRK